MLVGLEQPVAPVDEALALAAGLQHFAEIGIGEAAIFGQLLGAERVGRDNVPAIVQLEGAVHRAGDHIDARIVEAARLHRALPVGDGVALAEFELGWSGAGHEAARQFAVEGGRDLIVSLHRLNQCRHRRMLGARRHHPGKALVADIGAEVRNAVARDERLDHATDPGKVVVKRMIGDEHVSWWQRRAILVSRAFIVADLLERRSRPALERVARLELVGHVDLNHHHPSMSRGFAERLGELSAHAQALDLVDRSFGRLGVGGVDAGFHFD